MDPAEQAAILGVVQRNEVVHRGLFQLDLNLVNNVVCYFSTCYFFCCLKVIEKAERERVGKIIERVEKIKQRATDFGPHNCR